MCGILWTYWKPGVSPSTTCHSHSAQTGDYCMYTIFTAEGSYTWGAQLMAFIAAPVGGRYPSGHCACICLCKTQPAVGVDDWFLAVVNNSSGLNAKDAPPIMHCLPSKRRGWEIILKWDARHGMDGIVAPLSLGSGHRWHAPTPWTGCPAPIVSGGQSKDDKKQMETLAPGLSVCTPAAYEWLSCCELHFRISSTALPRGSTSLAPITLV